MGFGALSGCAPVAAPPAANATAAVAADRGAVSLRKSVEKPVVAARAEPLVEPAIVGPVAQPAPTATEACPDGMSLLPGGVCIDRWECSLLVVAADGSTKPWSPFQTLGRAATTFKAVSLPGVVPQGYISGARAEEACQTAGKRLCSSEEWQTACRGPERSLYPYGNRRQAHVCNDDGRGKHPLVDLTERLGLAPEQMWRDSMEHPMVNQLPNTLRKTGERSGCTNAYGVYDMVGNLHEWVDDSAGTFRGGFYMDTRINGEGCGYATTAHNKRYHDYSTGFRCCKDALPR